MGTSISHPSPKTLGWQAVAECYHDEAITPIRTATEIWRASQHHDSPLVSHIESDAVFECYESVRNGSNASEALKLATNAIISLKKNSIIAEIARRSIPAAFGTSDKLRGWRALFFAQVTDYLMSRDTSGFVGKEYRNKNIVDLVNFKESVKSSVKDTVKAINIDPRSIREWTKYVKNVIKRLSGVLI